jgi:diguanylate cyclase (GGDEF)-like protein
MEAARILLVSADTEPVIDVTKKLGNLEFELRKADLAKLGHECEDPLVALVAVTGHLTGTGLAALQQISVMNPYIPILHLASKGARIFQTSLLYRKLRPQVNAISLERHVRELCSIAKVLRERDRLSRVSRLAIHFDKSLGTLEFKSVISNFFGLLQQESGAENVIWISLRQDDLKLERAGAIQWHPLSSRPTQVTALEKMAEWVRANREAVPVGELAIIHPEFVGDDVITGAYMPRSDSVLIFVNAPAQTREITLSIVPLVDAVLDRALQYSEMRQLTFMDDLTELYNQRYLYHVLSNEVQRAERSGMQFCVLFIDADGLKKINDCHGHLVGSRLITEIGQIVKNTCRASDFGFRYGGDEYVIILTDTDLSQAAIVAERIRAEVEATTFEIADLSVNLTLSIGVAAFPEHAQTPDQIVAMADRAMYNAKKKSRNFVYLAS